MLTALYAIQSLGQPSVLAMDAQEKQTMLKYVKQSFRRRVAFLKEPSVHIEELPPQPSVFFTRYPTLKLIFGDDIHNMPSACPIDLNVLCWVADAFPMRVTRRQHTLQPDNVVALPPAPGNMNGMQQMMMQIMTVMNRQMNVGGSSQHRDRTSDIDINL